MYAIIKKKRKGQFERENERKKITPGNFSMDTPQREPIQQSFDNTCLSEKSLSNQ